MLKEFKKFISKGNVMDLAIGVIIGAAFGKIVSSLVEDILMPILGILVGGLDFTAFKLSIGNAVINYGVFLQNIVDFLIVSFCIFITVRFFNRLKTKAQKEEEKAPITKDILLLTEIRDLLKKKTISKKK